MIYLEFKLKTGIPPYLHRDICRTYISFLGFHLSWIYINLRIFTFPRKPIDLFDLLNKWNKYFNLQKPKKIVLLDELCQGFCLYLSKREKIIPGIRKHSSKFVSFSICIRRSLLTLDAFLFFLRAKLPIQITLSVRMYVYCPKQCLAFCMIWQLTVNTLKKG